MQVRDMTKGRPLRLILSVALPLMLGNVFQQLYTVVDAHVVGSVNGVEALAALGSADWFIWLFMGVITGLAQGFTIPMAQASGLNGRIPRSRCAARPGRCCSRACIRMKTAAGATACRWAPT